MQLWRRASLLIALWQFLAVAWIPVDAYAQGSLGVSIQPGFGTQNPFVPASATPFYSDPLRFLATASSPTAVQFNFGNPESRDNVVAGNTGTQVLHQYSALTSASQISQLRTVTVTATNGATASTAVSLGVPSTRMSVRTIGGLPVTGTTLLPEDRFTDTSDGSIEGHYSTWRMDGGAAVNLRPSDPISVGACGSHSMQLTTTYVPYSSPGSPIISLSQAYVTAVTATYSVRPVIATIGTPTASAASIDFPGFVRYEGGSDPFTVRWDLLNASGAVVSTQTQTTSISAVTFSIPKSSAPAGGSVRLTASISSSRTPSCASLLTSTATAPLPSCPVMSSSNVGVSYNCPGGVCRPNTAIPFTATSNGYSFGCAAHSFNWTFGDGGTASGENVAHTFAGTGSYTVTLTISNATQSYVTTVMVPIANPPAGCPTMTASNVAISASDGAGSCTSGSCRTGTPVTFAVNAFGYSFGCASHTFAWNFGDGTSAAGQTVSHAYGSAGRYTVTLTIANSTQTFVTTTVVDIRAPQPACPDMNATNWFIAFDDPNRTCTVFNGQTCPANVPINFRATPFNYPFECATHTFVWNFGDGTSSTEQNPTHPYVAGGTYNVTVTIRNPGQTFVAAAIVRVQATAKPPVILTFTATPRMMALGQSSTLSFVTQDATSVLIDGIGAQPASGSVTVTPTTTTTYTLRAMSGSASVSATETVQVFAQPAVSVSAFPGSLNQPSGVGGASTSLSLTNSGGAATTLNILQSGSFFTVAPASLTLAPGETRVVTLTGLAQPAGSYAGFVVPSGPGVPSNLQIPVRLLSARIPTGTVSAQAVDNRVDIAAPADTNPSGSVRYTNLGNDTLTGNAVADVPWLVPQTDAVVIPPGQTVDVRFTIDRSKRPDADALLGSVTGTLSLSYIAGSRAGKGPVPNQAPSDPIIDVKKSSVVDTVPFATTSATPGPVAPGEVVLFLAGIGHVRGSVGLFISDISVLNPASNRERSNVRFFYTPSTASSLAESRTANVQLASNARIAVGDVISTAFGQTSQGTLQLRSADAAKLIVSASVFNSENRSGTYGSVIPVIRSDRAAGPGQEVVLTGLLRDDNNHTNLYIQETAGVGVTVRTEFFLPDGTSLGSRSDDAGPFGLVQLGQQTVPPGAVSAIMTTSAGNFQAFATPVDRSSGDTWAVADWSRVYDYAPNATSIIPVAGVLAGAANTFFRTDVAVMNRTSSPASGMLRYVNRTGDTLSQSIAFGPHQTTVFSDVVGRFFGAASGSVGYITFTPITGQFAVTSRTYTTVAGKTATYGTAVPAVPASAGVKKGRLTTIVALKDASLDTVQKGRAATFRTNFGLVEASGQPARVRVTVNFKYPIGSSSLVANYSRDYDLAPNQFLLLNGIVEQVLGGRGTIGDVDGLEATFQIVEGDGSVIAFTSSVDNGTGDTILRLE